MAHPGFLSSTTTLIQRCAGERHGSPHELIEGIRRMTMVDGPVRVLVVEDSEDQRDLLRAYFEKAGCVVVTADSAEEAIPSYGESEPELAVVDLVLPGIDGWALVEKLRVDVPRCAVAVTSVLDADEYPRAEAILPKPFTRAQVLAVLAECVPRWSMS